MNSTKARLAAYWTTTAIIAVIYLIAGTAYLGGAAPVKVAIRELGYPVYLMTLLGGLKILAAFALLVPRLTRLKEWAYAGIAFNLIGAAFSHAAMDHPAAQIVAPLLLLALAVTSWSLRPA